MSEPLEKKKNSEDTKPKYAEIGPYLGLGIQLAVTVIIMVLLGNWLDEKYHKAPLFLIIGACLGTFAGLYNLIKTVLQIEKKLKK
jgi:F0F1-type ATP synthase assembly protein I